MDTEKILPKDVSMMNRSNTIPRLRVSRDSPGFTLVELLVASVVAGIVSTITWYILIESTKSDVRAEFRRRLHEDWNRATTLIQSEISLSDFIQSSNLSPDQVTAEGCELLQNAEEGNLKLRMHLVGALPDIIYGVRRIGSLPDEESRKWTGGADAGVLIRCGPRMTIGENGKIEYIQGNYQQSIVLDNLDLSDGGLRIGEENTSQKLVEFSLSMNENINNQDSATVRTRTLNSRGVSRINEVPPIPSDQSVCETICTVEDRDCGFGVTTLLPTGDSLSYQSPRVYEAPTQPGSVFGTDTICTNRSLVMNDEIDGANGNYVMDGNPTPGRSNPQTVILKGGEGRNILLGTPVADRMEGGPKHDALIGRGGNDTLMGNAGNDSLLPWSSASQETSTVSINGGNGFDRVYLNDDESAYILSSANCISSYCLKSISGGGTLKLSNVEQLVYKQSVRNLNQ